MKKLLSVLLAVVLLMSVVPLGAFTLTASAATVTSGTTGDCVWSLDGTVLTISGNGEMVDRSWLDYISNGKITEVIIEEGVTNITYGAFSFCYNLENVVIPDGVTSIGTWAFQECANLKSVNIPNSVTYIGDRAFQNCSSLADINIPDNDIYIAWGAFDGTAYAGDESNWDNGVFYVGNHLIEADYYFTGDYTVKSGTKTIAESAFSGVRGLTSIFIPDSVVRIGYCAFSDCEKLININIPKSVTNIADGAFRGCSSLEKFIIDSNNPAYTTDQLGILFNKNKTKLICVSVGRGLTVYKIPDTVTSIADFAFENCTSLVSITIPDSVTSIGECAFYGCTGLTSVTIPDSVTSIGEYAFYGCTSLTSITIPDSVTSMGHNPFEGTAYYNDEKNWENNVLYINNHLVAVSPYLTGNYIIKSKTKTIVNYAFEYSDITSVTIPSTVVTIGSEAFRDCLNLKNVYYTGTEQDRENITIGGGNSCLTNATWHYNMLYPDAASNTWYSDAIRYVSKEGIMTGYGGTTKFGTADNIQRQDFVVILARLAGVDLDNYVSSGNYSFADVPSGAYYEKAIMWAADVGITTGYAGGTVFGVGDKITREQLVTFLYRYAKYTNGGVAPTVSENAADNAAAYADFAAVTDYAREAVIWALENGVIKGQGGTHIAPGGNALRCEVAQIIYNIFLNNTF